MKKLYFCIILCILIGMLLFEFVYTPYARKKVFENHLIFNTSEIKGQLSKIEISSGFVYFELQNSKNRYQFKPFSEKFNNYSIFSGLAEKGDSVYKKSFGDTLYLFKNYTIYKYTFEKINEDTYK